jgi:purine-binding chemotaxis protein CheW
MSYAVKKSGRELRKHIAFGMGDLGFWVNGMPICKNRGWGPVRVLPQSLSDVIGVMDLRDALLPIINPASKLRMEFDEMRAGRVAELRSQAVGLLVEVMPDISSEIDDVITSKPAVVYDFARQDARRNLATHERAVCFVELADLFSEPESEAA